MFSISWDSIEFHWWEPGVDLRLYRVIQMLPCGISKVPCKNLWNKYKHWFCCQSTKYSQLRFHKRGVAKIFQWASCAQRASGLWRTFKQTGIAVKLVHYWLIFSENPHSTVSKWVAMCFSMGALQVEVTHKNDRGLFVGDWWWYLLQCSLPATQRLIARDLGSVIGSCK